MATTVSSESSARPAKRVKFEGQNQHDKSLEAVRYISWDALQLGSVQLQGQLQRWSPVNRPQQQHRPWLLYCASWLHTYPTPRK